MRPLVVAVHARTGMTALNVVTAALDADPRTAGTEVVFAPKPDAVGAAVASGQAAGRPVLVAWSFYSGDAPWAEAELRRARALAPGARHVAGGVHATAEPEATLRAGFDLVVRGEGESTFVELVAALGERRSLSEIPGTASLLDGVYRATGSAPRRPLDDFPAFNLRYGKWNPIEITRGCIYACAFCQTPFAFKARFRHRSVENVRRHVRAMVEQGARYARFVTPTALSYGASGEAPDLGQVEALLAAVRAELPAGGKLYFGSFPSEVRPEHVTPEALAILKRFVDNDNLVIGGQSGSERVLAAAHRGHGVAEVERAVRYAAEAGFRPDVDFLFGLPGESGDERRASLAFAERLIGLGARVHNHAFMPLPGTPLSRARPEPLEPDVVSAMNRLESSGALYGQWRRQLLDARELVKRRGG